MLLVKYKGALLIINVYFFYCVCYYYANEFYKRIDFLFATRIQYILFILTPLFGWMADACLGRYTMFLVSVAFEILNCLLWSGTTLTNIKIALAVINYITSFTQYFAIAACAVYALPFLTEQMIGASGDELSAAVDWYIWSDKAAYMINARLLQCTINIKTLNLMSTFLYCGSLAIIIASLILFKHWLVIHEQTTNPFTQVAKVLNYARKNKYPRNRSALTYWEDDFPSRIDLGKDKYGGPFTEENVEDVKTILRLIPVIAIAWSYIVFDQTYSETHHYMETDANNPLTMCLLQEDFYSSAIATIYIPLLHFFIKPLFPNFCARLTMLKQIWIGIFLYLFGCIGSLAINVTGHIITPNATCMFEGSGVPIGINYYWYNIPLFVSQSGSIIMNLVLVKFVIAQSPHRIKGLLFAVALGFKGIYHNIGELLVKLVSYLPHVPPSCGFYYYLVQVLVVTTALVLFTVVSSRYKLRQRNNPVNIHLIVGDHVDRYITQRENQALLSETEPLVSSQIFLQT